MENGILVVASNHIFHPVQLKVDKNKRSVLIIQPKMPQSGTCEKSLKKLCPCCFFLIIFQPLRFEEGNRFSILKNGSINLISCVHTNQWFCENPLL